MALRNPRQTTAHLGDLVIVVTANGKHTNKTGMRLWFECEVATVVGVSEARHIKAVLFARDWRVERRADLINLVALVPYPAAQIDVPLAMMAAREHGQPFGSLEEVRTAVRPFVLVDLAERGYDPAAGEQGATNVDADAPDAQAFAIGDWVMVSDRDRKDYGRHGNVIGFTYDPAQVVVEYGTDGGALVAYPSALTYGVPIAESEADR